MTIGDRNDPCLSFRFLVEIDGLVTGGFSEISGLQIETVTETYREGGVNDYEHKLAGPTRYPANLVMKRGLTDSILWTWCQDVRQGIIQRKSVSIILLDSGGEERWRWNLEGAYPVRWNGPDLRAGTGEVALETLELVHQGLKRS